MKLHVNLHVSDAHSSVRGERRKKKKKKKEKRQNAGSQAPVKASLC